MAGTEARLRDCSLSHAVDAAVAARIPAIASRVSGPALAVHVTAAMHAALNEGRWLCDTHEPQWLAPCYQWALVLDSLRAQLRREPGSGPHPRTAEWEAAYSRAIDGPDCASQLEMVQRWHDADQRDQCSSGDESDGRDPAGSLTPPRQENTWPPAWKPVAASPEDFGFPSMTAPTCLGAARVPGSSALRRYTKAAILHDYLCRIAVQQGRFTSSTYWPGFRLRQLAGSGKTHHRAKKVNLPELRSKL